MHDHKSYQGARTDLIAFVDSPKKVLDVGCNNGSTGLTVKNKFGDNVFVVGLDYNAKSIEIASKVLDEAYTVDLNNLESVSSVLKNHTFDYIVIGDTLEHLIAPKKLVSLLWVNHRQSKGKILISLPNIYHYSLLFNIVRHSWPRNERGIFDKTHLQNYGFYNLKEFCQDDSKITYLKFKYRWLEKRGSKVDFLLNLLDYVPYIKYYFTFQFIFELKEK